MDAATVLSAADQWYGAGAARTELRLKNPADPAPPLSFSAWGSFGTGWRAGLERLRPVNPWGDAEGVASMVRRVAMVSLHTSPLDQPGTGDAGGMNVYVVELSRRLAGLGIEVEIFTRATSSALPPRVELTPGVTVRNVAAGPFEGLSKNDLPPQLCTFARSLLRAEAAHEPGHYDVVHSHYWLSGQVGLLARDRWAVPLVHTMHTMAKVKNASLAEDDAAGAARPADRRGAGGRGSRPAGREHRRRGQAADRPVRRRPRQGRRRPSRRRPGRVPARRSWPPHGTRSGCRAMPSYSPSSGGSSR